MHIITAAGAPDKTPTGRNRPEAARSRRGHLSPSVPQAFNRRSQPWLCTAIRSLEARKEGTMDTALAVRARGITKYFGDVVALDHVDLDVAQGQIHGLVGPNGAGKTTLLGLLLGLAVADSGHLEILGAPVGRALAAPDGVAGFVDGPGLYPTLTAQQNLAALAALRRRDAPTAGVDEALDAGRADRRRRRQGPRLLPRHAPAAGPGRRAADQAPAAGARRAVQRSGPGGQEARPRRPDPAGRRTAPRSSCPATGWTTWRRCAPRSPSWPPDAWSSPAR